MNRARISLRNLIRLKKPHPVPRPVSGFSNPERMQERLVHQITRLPGRFHPNYKNGIEGLTATVSQQIRLAITAPRIGFRIGLLETATGLREVRLELERGKPCRLTIQHVQEQRKVG
ncbi:MAG: hypothetical protein J4215_01495 [Candidatus Diapherotrites archaeon]|uniref:Uncharacterized protein n=1 Tax=Candidatus Iainarchaeum sp. TaxID=3101447 RepID=A0A8T4L6R8_9ARCH|nr:hypothetical protein [Candidatus Diapherotrites archaeon]